jgi:hypothetical protein
MGISNKKKSSQQQRGTNSLCWVDAPFVIFVIVFLQSEKGNINDQSIRWSENGHKNVLFHTYHNDHHFRRSEYDQKKFLLKCFPFQFSVYGHFQQQKNHNQYLAELIRTDRLFLLGWMSPFVIEFFYFLAIWKAEHQ